MTYVKTNWVDDVTPLSATNMNNIEDGIANVYDGAWERISGITVASALTQVEFANLDSKYNEFRIVCEGISATTGTKDLIIRFNSDSSTNYNSLKVSGGGAFLFTSYSAFSSIPVSSVFVANNRGVDNIAVINITNSKATTIKKVFIDMINYSSTFAVNEIVQMKGNWTNKTDKINSIQLSASATNGIGVESKFTIWGAV